jgi:hypothetical protein
MRRFKKGGLIVQRKTLYPRGCGRGLIRIVINTAEEKDAYNAGLSVGTSRHHRTREKTTGEESTGQEVRRMLASSWDHVGPKFKPFGPPRVSCGPLRTI